MNRRHFLTSSAAAAATLAAGAGRLPAQSAGPARQFYDLRRYHLLNGPLKTATDAYFRDALIPALNRQGITPVGVFNVSIGVQGSSAFVLMPAPDANTLAAVEPKLAADAEYQKAAASFLDAPATRPDFVRMESALFSALDAMPQLVAPPKGPRMFEMRTYESQTWQDHIRKVEMVNVGELPIFKASGFRPVFMGDAVIGPRQPSLTYMISFETLADREKYWQIFFASAAWKKLTSNPRYNFETLVSNVDNTILTPAAYSQI